jgi:hypothetical protein
VQGGGHTVFAELQIHAELHSTVDDVVGPCSEVHVSDGAPGQHQTCNDLAQIICRDAVSEASVKQGTLFLVSLRP